MSADYDGYFERQFGRGHAITEKDVMERARWAFAPYTNLLARLDVRPSDTILEIGSGLGSLYANLESTDNYVGLEVDAQAAAFTNSYFGTDCFKNMSLEEFDASDRFDFVFGFEVLEHLRDPLGAIEKIHGLLRPGGSFAGTTPYPYRRYVVADPTHLFLLHPRSWERLFRLAGFQDVEVRPVSYLPILWRLSRKANRAIPFYVPVRYVLSSTLIVAKG